MRLRGRRGRLRCRARRSAVAARQEPRASPRRLEWAALLDARDDSRVRGRAVGRVGRPDRDGAPPFLVLRRSCRRLRRSLACLRGRGRGLRFRGVGESPRRPDHGFDGWGRGHRRALPLLPVVLLAHRRARSRGRRRRERLAGCSDDHDDASDQFAGLVAVGEIFRATGDRPRAIMLKQAGLELARSRPDVADRGPPPVAMDRGHADGPCPSACRRRRHRRRPSAGGRGLGAATGVRKAGRHSPCPRGLDAHRGRGGRVRSGVRARTGGMRRSTKPTAPTPGRRSPCSRPRPSSSCCSHSRRLRRRRSDRRSAIPESA